MSDITIRPPRLSEYEAAGEVTVAAYEADGHLANDVGYDVELRDVARRVSLGEVMVAVDGAGKLLGTVTIVRPGTPYAEISRPGELEFRMLAVAPSARGRGIGEALTRAVLERARELEAGKVVLSSVDSMHSAHRLSERIGFRRLPERDWQVAQGIRLIAYELPL